MKNPEKYEMSISERWRDWEKKSYRHFVSESLRKSLFLSEDDPSLDVFLQEKIVSDTWEVTSTGSYLLNISGLEVLDFESGKKRPFQIILPYDTTLRTRPKCLGELLRFIVGNKNPGEYEYLGSGTRAFGGEISWNGIPLACIHIYDLDIDGVERFEHHSVLSLSLGLDNPICQVPTPIIASTNCFITPIIEGDIPTQKEVEAAQSELLETVEKLIQINMWDKKFDIDSQAGNYRKQNGSVFNIDPVVWHGKFIL